MRGDRGQAIDQRICDLLLDEDPSCRHADLPLVQPRAPACVRRSRVKIRIVKDDQRILSAEFERHLLEMPSRESPYATTDSRRSRESNHRDVWIRTHRL